MKHNFKSLYIKYFGTMFPGSEEYQAIVKDDGCEVLHRETNYGEVSIERMFCAVEEFLNNLEIIINKYDIASWGEWCEHAPVTDSYNFDFILQYHDVEPIEVHGYGTVPDEDAMKELCQLFSLFL